MLSSRLSCSGQVPSCVSDFPRALNSADTLTSGYRLKIFRRYLNRFLALHLLLFCAPARATLYPPTTMDSIVLGADTILIATVALTEPDGETDDLAWVRLTDLHLVTDRWDCGREFTLPVRSHIGTEGSVAPFRWQPKLVPGKRYLLFLKGGEWDHAPVIRNANAVYEIRYDGAVLCDGGLVFGIGMRGLVCGVPSDFVGPWLDEHELASRLRSWAVRAAARRPDMLRRNLHSASPPANHYRRETPEDVP